MQLFPLVKFYLRNEQAINDLFSHGTSDPAIIAAAATILENIFPAQKALIADLVATLKDVTAPPPPPASVPDVA